MWFRRLNVLIGLLGSLLLSDGMHLLYGGEDERYLEGLRRRRLFELAEKYCEIRCADSSLAVIERGDLTVEWIRALSDHARHSLAEDRKPLIRTAHDVAARFQAAHAGHSMNFLVRTQEALADATMGELARLEAEVAADGAAGRDEARRLSRTAARALEQIDRELSEYLPQRFRKAPDPNELTAEQLAALQHQVRLQAARAQRNLALAYEEGSDDRLAILGRGLQLLDPSLRQLTPEMPLYAPAYLEVAAQQRLLGKLDVARQTLTRLDPSLLDDETTLALRTEALRITLAQKDMTGVSRLLALGDVDATQGVAAAEWDFARLEVVLARWRDLLAKGQDAKAIQDEALRQLEQISERHGPFWKHRGDLQLVRFGASVDTKNSDLLSRTADSLLTQGRPDEAIAAYDQAISQAKGAGRAAEAFGLAMKAGLVEQRRRRHMEAAGRLRVAAIQVPQEKRAAESHLAAIWNLAQYLREQSASPTPSPAPTTPDSPSAPGQERTAAPSIGTQYVQWLDEHVRQWPTSTTCNQALLWLGTWKEVHGDSAAAIKAFRQVAPELPEARDAWRGVLRCETRRWFHDGESRATPAANLVASRDERARELADWLGKPPASEPLTAEELRDVAMLRVCAALWIPDQESVARETLAELKDLPAEQIGRLLVAIQEALAAAAADRRGSLGTIAVDAIKNYEARRGELSAPARARFDSLRGAALVATGKRQEAVEAYRALAAASPQDGDVQQVYAELLEAGEDQASKQAALDQWRRIAAKSPPRTERWYRAKLGVATMLVRLGKREEAEKFIRFLEATPPGISEPWRARFELIKPKAG